MPQRQLLAKCQRHERFLENHQRLSVYQKVTKTVFNLNFYHKIHLNCSQIRISTPTTLSPHKHMDYAGGVVSASYPPTFWSKLPGRDMTVPQRLYNMFNKMANMAMMREVLLQAGMGSNEVPPFTHDFGTVSGTKLLLEPNIYSCIIFVTVTEVTKGPKFLI